MSTIRANAILDAAGGNTATFNGIPLRPGVLDPENRIINGAFDFWQRGASHSTNGYGSADRWGNTFVGGTVTMSRQAFTLGDTLGSNNPAFFLRQSVSGQTLASHAAYVTQRIEDVRSYAGQTITALGWARRSSGSGNMAINFTQGFGTGGSPSGFVNTVGQTITLTGAWSPFAATFAVPSVATRTLGTDGNSFLQINIWTSGGSDFNAATNSLGLQTIGVDLWGIHIKVGTHTTAAVDLYKAPELGSELVRCQRYYYSTGTSRYEYRTYGIGGEVIYAPITFPARFRVQPSVSVNNIIASNCTGAVAGGAAGGGQAGFIQATVTATGLAAVSVSLTADAEL